MQDALLTSLGTELAETSIRIKDHYCGPAIFDHIVKFHYDSHPRDVLVLGSSTDSYYGVHVRNILREECGINAPLIDIQALPRIVVAGFAEILVCYNRAQVEPYLTSWAPPAGTSLVYLDDLLSRYFWLFTVTQSLETVFSLRDTIRGLLGQGVEQTRALQFDSWNAVAKHIREAARKHDTLFLVGSGCGLLPTLLRGLAKKIVVFESDPLYLSNLTVAAQFSPCEIAPFADFHNVLGASNDAWNCVILCDALNRISEPERLEPVFSRLADYYFTGFLSCETKPPRPAVFRKIGARNIAFGQETCRDRRCHGEMPWIWLPREKSLNDIFQVSEFVTLHANDELFVRHDEHASAYVALKISKPAGGP